MMKKRTGLLFLLFALLHIQGYAQCGTETFTVVDWCENSYAEWKITNPDPLAQYHWYEPVYAANGVTVTDTIDRGYGANSAGTHFVSPYRYTTPAGPLTAGWDSRKFWYVKEKPINFSLGPPTSGTHAIAPTTGYSMNFTSTLETNINFVTVPIFSYYVSPTPTYYVQIQIDSKYSQIYYFKSTDLASIGGNVFLLRVPVNITTQAGTHVMTIVTNPASPTAGTEAIGASTNQLNLAMLNTAATFPMTSTNGINITGSSNTSKSMIYKWETSTYCPYTFSPIAKKETDITKCCTPVTAGVVISSSNPIIVSGTDNSILTITAYTSTSSYFQWYKDGSPLTGGYGIPNMSITATTLGSYSVREVQDPIRLDNVSCYMEAFTLVQERALFAKVNNPKAAYCIGDKVNIEAYGTSIGNVSWSPASLAENPNLKITDVTLATTGTLTFTATADLFPDDLIADGGFENYNPASPVFQTSMTYTAFPGTPSTNAYTIGAYVPNQSYWNTNNPFDATTQTKGDGKFLISDAPTAAGSLLWKETVTVTPSKNYTFSIDHVNISWNADATNLARIADNDLEFDVLINGTVYGSFKTDGQGQYVGVGRWKTDEFVWNSGSATQAIIEIKTKSTALPGYDFGFDNIRFGGPQTQTATVSIGPIADCFDIVASQSACVGASKTLTAKAINTITGEEVGVIDRWEAPVGTIVGSGKTITVTPATTTTYTVYGYFPGGNLIQNGDFELGANGFNHGSANGLYTITTSPYPGSIAILKNPQTETNNNAYANMGDHTTGTGKMLLVDPGSADGDIISYNFNANAGQNYLFSLWAANAVNFSQNPNGISASLSFIINGPGVTDLQISSIDLPRNNAWIQLSDVWKPTTTGAYTLTVRAKGDATLGPIQSAATGLTINGGNDYVLDDIVLAEPTSKVYSKTIVVTPCITCTQPTNVTITAPVVAADTICQGSGLTLSGTVTVPAVSSAAGGFKYSWIKVGATPATDVVLQTAAIIPTVSVASSVPNYIIAAGVLANGNYKYILRVEDGTSNSSSCFLDDTLTLVVTAPAIAGTISANQEICSGATPLALTGTASTGGVAIKNYKWESAVAAAGPWTQAAAYSTVGTGFAPGALTATTYYRRRDSSGVCASVPTNTIVVRVNNKPVLSALIPVLRDTLCVGEDFNLSTTIPLADSTGVHASANGGYYFYWKQYQAGVVKKTTAPLPYKNLLSATKKAELLDSGMYYLIVQDGIGATKCKDSVGLRIIIHNGPTSKGLIAAHQEICLSDAAVPFTEVASPVGNNAPIIYQQWYTTNDSLGTPILTKLVGENNTTYDAGSPANTLYYVRKDSVKYCEAVATNFLKIRVNNSVVTDTILPLENDTLCVSAGSMFQLKGLVDIFSANASINNGYYFTWMHYRDGVLVLADTHGPLPYEDFPVTPRAAVEADSGSYYLIIQDGLGATVCQDTLKTKVVVYQTCTLLPPPCVKPVFVSATLTGNDTLCIGNNFTLQKDIIDISAGPPLDQYYFSWRRINNAGSVLLTPPSAIYSDLVLTNVTQVDSGRYYLIVQDGIGSDPLCKDSSAAISIVINAPLTIPVIAASDTICQGSTPSPFTGATGLATKHQWYISTDSFKTVPASQLIAGAIVDSYQSGALSTTSYFIRKDSVAACPAVNSNIITIQVDKPVVRGVVGNDTVVCSGSPILAFKEITAASGGASVFNYQWQTSNDNVTFTDIAGATNNIYQSPDIISPTYFRRIDSSGVCGSKITDTIFVDAVTGVNPGLIAGASPTICYNTIPTVSFTNVASASNGSGGPGSDTYQWQISTDGMYWTDIAGATNLSYAETSALTDTMYYRREVGMGPGTCDTSYTLPIAINVYDPFVVGSIPITTTVCEGTAVTINELTAASGGGDPNTPPVYEWIESIDKGVTWTTSAGISNQVNYVTPALTDSIWYRRVVTVTCNKDTTNIMKINVDSMNTVSVAMSDISTCAGTAAVFAPTFLGAGITPEFIWYTRPANAPITDPWTQISTGSPPYTIANPQAADDGTFYKVVLTSSFGCNSGTVERIAKLNVTTVIVPVVSIVSNPAGPICDTATTITYTATAIQGDAGAAIYQWYEYDGITNTAIPAATGTSYTPAVPPSNGDQVYVVMTSDVSCANPTTATSNKVILDVRITPDPIITNNDTTVCTPFEVTLKASSITSGSNQFQWYVNGVLIPNANQINHPATTSDFPVGIDTARYTFIEDNGVCNTESDTVTVVILQSPSAYAGTDITAVEGETISLNGSVSSNTTNLVWIPSGGLSDRYVLNPSLVVPSASTVYTLVAYNNANKCSSSDAVTIYVEKRIVIPNVITVNGDGANDTWKIENIENFPEVEFLIFNRWGNLVWKSTGYDKQWDGTNYRNGEVLPEGTYYYIIDLHSVKVKQSYSGWVQLVK